MRYDNHMKRILFILISGAAVLFIIVLFFVFSALQKQPAPKNNQITVPTKIPGSKQNSTGQTRPPVIYDTKKTNELVEAVKNKKGLSQNGIAAKEKLILSLNSTSGSVYSSLQVRIDYIKSPDIFQVEILSNNIAQAKQEAVNWMISQGFTKDDVCRLPLSFFLSTAASLSLQSSNTIFNPLPDGC